MKKTYKKIPSYFYLITLYPEWKGVDDFLNIKKRATIVNKCNDSKQESATNKPEVSP